MSTSYYVKNINCFLDNLNTGTISNNRSIYISSDNCFSMSNLFYTQPERNLFGYAYVDGYYVLTPISYEVGTTNYKLNQRFYTMGASQLSDVFISTWTSSKYDPDTYWNPGNSSDFRTKLCTYFENNKLTTSGLNFGKDNREINLVLFTLIDLSNSSPNTYHIPIFYHGNTPNYDFIEVV